jgi:VWFA-related protein
MTSQESAVTFQVNVRLVEVRVVVRDAKGKAVGTLHKEDFKVFDNGKPQVVTKFDVEKPGQRVAEAEKSSESSAPENVASGNSFAPALAERYIAYLFDDIHLAWSDLIPVRQAAQKNLAALQTTDRAAIFTTSGQNQLDFTDDQNKLREALNHLRTRSISNDSPTYQCPKMTYYMADEIWNKHDGEATAVAIADALVCAFGGDPRFGRPAEDLVEGAARQWVATGDMETRLALASLKNVIRRLAAAPGQRSIILVSPGFITPQRESDVDEIVDRAVRADVTVSALDARGLYVIVPGGDASERGTVDPRAAAIEIQYQTAAASANADVMAELADSTGGTFFHNNNDLLGGFRQLAATPEYYYVLGFSPQNLKTDGRFHKLKVTLNSDQKYSLQARRGYFAPMQLLDSDRQAKQEIEDAVFSQEEMRDLPVDLHTQFFKLSDEQARLSVLAHIDLKHLNFKKVEGRNNNNLTIVSGIFDGNGNFVTANEKVLQMRLKDETLASKLDSGVSVKSEFDLKPGSYLVRLVVRDEHGQIAAQSGAVRIP